MMASGLRRVRRVHRRHQPYRRTTAAATLCLVVLAAACGGETSVTEFMGPDPVRCATVVSPASASVPADGGRVTVTIESERDCAWTAETSATWLQLSSTEGQGAATVQVTASPNPHGAARTAAVLVNAQQVAFSQEARPCEFELRPASVEIGAEGGTGSVEVTTNEGCAWKAATSASWLRVPDTEHTGSGSLEFDASANQGASREAAIRIGGQVVTVLQSQFRSAPGPGPVPGPAPTPGVAAPAGLTVSVISDTRVDLRWTTTDPAAQTQVYRDGAMVALKNAGVTSHQDTGLTPATSYTYVVRHVVNGLIGPASNTVVGRPVFFATGGSVSSAGRYRQHVFTSNGAFVVTQGGTIDEIVIIGGGGGGGGSEAGTDYGGGGGGAGGVRVILRKTESNGTYSVVIGGGGAGGRSRSSDPANNNGGSGSASSYGSESARGGGGGAGAGVNYHSNGGIAGGSGGGGVGADGGAGTPGEGNAGGAGGLNPGGAAGGGGGGSKTSAGSPGTGVGGRGGAGYATWIGTVATGGDGGRVTGSGADGVAAGDGGDGNTSGGDGGRGASGAVLIRYLQ